MKRFYIILVILLICFLLYVLYNHSNITSLSKYRPFTGKYKNNINANIHTERIKNNVPKIDAATAFYPFASNIVESIYDENSYKNELSYTSTSKAYQDLLDDIVDIVIVTSPSENQQKMIERSNKKICFIPIAKEALVFYTWKENPVNNLTIEDIKRIYLGQITNWKGLQGNNKRIQTFQLKKDNGSQTCFENIVKNNIIDNKNHYELDDMGKIIDKVAWNKNSIGYAFNSFYTKIYSNSKLKLFSINGIEPSSENIVSGKYPQMNNVYLGYNENNNNVNIKSIIDFIFSEQGQKLIEYMGLQPVQK